MLGHKLTTSGRGRFSHAPWRVCCSSVSAALLPVVRSRRGRPITGRRTHAWCSKSTSISQAVVLLRYS